MTTEEKRELLQKAISEVQQHEYTTWINWQAALAQVERMIKCLSALEGS
jgi:hypothetical protein